LGGTFRFGALRWWGVQGTNVQLSTNVDRSTNVEFSTLAPLLQNPVRGSFIFFPF